MAAVTVSRARPVAPVGYEVNDKCVLSDDVDAGDLLAYTGNMVNGLAEMGLNPTGAAAHGIALQDGYDGERGFSVGIQGEMDGFSGLTPGDSLFQGAATAGKMDDAAGTAVPVRAVTATRIRYNFV